jgi:dihydrofolate synthase / folylpolyglutamate synthase
VGLTYRQALDYLVMTGSRGIKEGLQRTEALLEHLDHPEAGLRGVLVAGTNGKGSTCALIESACRAAGLRTVMLVKPHLCTYRERIVLDGKPISDGAFAALVDEVLPVVDRVEPIAGAPTQFEILTALGVLAAQRHRPDVVICEVGMGGRLDSTNVLDLGVAAITSIALDHRQVLGDTIAEIASEKAGIIKPDNDVVTSARGEALTVIRNRASAVGARQVLAIDDEIKATTRSRGRDGVEVTVRVADLDTTARLPLLGAFQGDNAAVAAGCCAVLRARGVPVDSAAVVSGFATVSWPGRLQWLALDPPLLIDGAHNPAAIAAVVPVVREVCGERRIITLFGAMADKDLAEMLSALRPLGTVPVFAQAGTPRAASATDLARLWGAGARAISSLPDALAAARMLAAGDGVVFVCGSIYLAGDVLHLVGDDHEG